MGHSVHFSMNQIMGNTMVDNNVRLCYHYNSAENLSAHFLNLAFI